MSTRGRGLESCTVTEHTLWNWSWAGGFGPTQHSHLCFVGAQHKNAIVCAARIIVAAVA